MSHCIRPWMTGLALCAALLCMRSAAAAPTVRNTSVAHGATRMENHIHGKYLVYGTAETTTDLNGDGDTNDVVATRFDTAGATTTNIGIAMDDFVYLRGKHALIEASEAGEGADLNNDGDTADTVMHQYNLKTGALKNLGVAAATAIVGQNMVLLPVHEQSHGNQDQNGDGDRFDFILHVYDLKTNTLYNTQRPGPTSLDKRWGHVTWNRSIVAWAVREVYQGQDLNNDGDTNDRVLHAYKFASQTLTNVGLAVPAPAAFGEQGWNENGGTVDWPYIVFEVSESAHGAADRNGDGDTGDNVLAILNGSNLQVTNLGYANTGFRQTRAGRTLFRVPEAGQGAGDLNNDGDTADTGVLHIHDTANGTTTNKGYHADFADFSADVAIVTFDEVRNGLTDDNLDGDYFDACVPHMINLTTLADVTVPLCASPLAIRVDRGWVAMRVHEYDSGGTDFNGDGDANDFVLFTMKTDGTNVRNTGLHSNSPLGVTKHRVLFTVRESAADLNNDGDTSDDVYQFVDARYGTVTNLALAQPYPGGVYDHAAQDGFLWFLVGESEQGVDLNGDGDTNDDVVHSTR